MNLLYLYNKIEFWILRKLNLIKFKKVGEKSIIKWGLYGDSYNVEIGNYVYIGENAQFWGYGGIKILDGTIIGPNVVIRSSNHDYKSGDFIPYGPGSEKRKVIIGENCWIGDNVLIAPGTKMGEGCIIGMGAVVSGNIPDHSIVVGNPGKVIKTRNVEEYKKLKKECRIYLKYKLLGKI